MRILIGCLLALAPANLSAQTLKPERAIEDPRSYLGKTVRIGPINCVDNPSGGFICLTVARNQGFRIDASYLGEKTAQNIAEKLIGECKGTANLTSRRCEFEAEITPVGVDRDTVETDRGSRNLVVITSMKIELFSRGR